MNAWYILLFVLGLFRLEAQPKDDTFKDILDLMILIEDQLHILTTKMDGTLSYEPIMDKFPFQLSALAIHPKNYYLYGWAASTGQLMVINRQSEIIEKIKVQNESNRIITESLDFGVILQDKFCAMNKVTGKLYAIDLQTHRFTVREFKNKHQVCNLAVDHARQQLISIYSDACLYSFHPNFSDQIKSKQLRYLPYGLEASVGALWMTSKGRILCTRNQGESLFEIEIDEHVAHRFNAEFNPAKIGDAVSSPRSAPSFLDESIIECSLEVSDPYFISKWTGLYEYQNDHFLLQKSKQNKIFDLEEKKPSYGDNLNKNPYSKAINKLSDEIYIRLVSVSATGKHKLLPTVAFVKNKPLVFASPKMIQHDQSLKLSIKDLLGEQLQLRIFNTYGKMVQFKKISLYSDDLCLSLDISDLSGHYILEFKTAQKLFRSAVYVLSKN